MVRCAITDGMQVAADRGGHRKALMESARGWAKDGIELVQLREKSLEAGALLGLAQEMIEILQSPRNSTTRLLINGRADVAIAAQADGVHLTSSPGELTPEQVRSVFAHAGRSNPVVSVSCHTVEDVRRAKAHRADYILFGPVFEKRSGDELLAEGSGLDALRQACEAAAPIPVLALGGVTEANASDCVAAGAAGIAGIRLFRSVA